mgnify:CR=1 FL=1
MTLLPGVCSNTQKMLPVGRLVSRLEEPSSGSKAISYLRLAAPAIAVSSSSEAIAATCPVSAETKRSLATTSMPFCVSPCTLTAPPPARSRQAVGHETSEWVAVRSYLLSCRLLARRPARERGRAAPSTPRHMRLGA